MVVDFTKCNIQSVHWMKEKYRINVKCDLKEIPHLNLDCMRLLSNFFLNKHSLTWVNQTLCHTPRNYCPVLMRSV